MIRIIYHWKVDPENLEDFINIWKVTTNKIHEEVKGARGSSMIKNADDGTDIKTVARWDSLDDWKQFWKDSKPSQMSSMHELGKRGKVEFYHQNI